MLTLLLIYYVIGLEYSYQRYKRLDRLDDIHGSEHFYATVIQPLTFVLIEVKKRRLRRIKPIYKSSTGI